MEGIPLRAILKTAVQQLALVSDSARLDAEILLGHILNKSRHHPYVWPEYQLTNNEQRRFRALCQRRAAGEPLAYILGHREFWSLDLEVTRDTFIPRPDTECLVEVALALIPITATWRIADLGTGSGAIALALAKERPGCLILATDHSPRALAVAQRNAVRLGLDNIAFVKGEWCAALRDSPYHLIVSNPPYVAEDDPHLRCGDVRFEPRSALVGGRDGLAAIRLIARHAHCSLARNGRLLLEHGHDQGPRVRALLRKLGYRAIKCYRDYAHRERVAEGVAP